MIVKIHATKDRRLILAVCDSELLGKKIEDGKKQLDLASDFYKGEEKTEKETADLMRNSYIINMVGKRSVDIAVKEGLMNKENINKISGIPYAQISLQAP